MPENAKLLAIEVNAQFCARLRRIDDTRLVVHCGSADELRDALSQYRLSAPDAVVSGIPFSTIERVAGSRVLEAIASVLAPGGRFVAYQVRKQVDELSRPLLGRAHVELEPFNIPPLRLYRWQKLDGERHAMGAGRPTPAARSTTR